MTKWVGALLLALALVTPAAAQTMCASERTTLIEQLKSRYQEAPVAIGLVSSGSVLEILASNSGSWTILITRPTGLTCVVAAGEAWDVFSATEDTSSRPAEGPGF